MFLFCVLCEQGCLTLWKSEAPISTTYSHISAICPLVTVLFVCGHQLITAFEKAMVLMDPIPGEEHRKVSADYVKCLSEVSVPYLRSVSPPEKFSDN